ncbi:MAG: hypothetical protein ACYC69_14455 [Thermodesulfovibrionales bacterium]
MKHLLNAKMIVVVLSIFLVSMALMPGFVTKVMAENLPPGSVQIAAVGDAGASGGGATNAGISSGTVLLIVLGAAGLAALALSSGGSNNTTVAHP